MAPNLVRPNEQGPMEPLKGSSRGSAHFERPKKGVASATPAPLALGHLRPPINVPSHPASQSTLRCGFCLRVTGMLGLRPAESPSLQEPKRAFSHFVQEVAPFSRPRVDKHKNVARRPLELDCASRAQNRMGGMENRRRGPLPSGDCPSQQSRQIMDTSRRRPTPEGPRMSAVSRQVGRSAKLVSLLLVGSLVLAHCSAGLPSFLMDCQANEQFIECGSCEGSCQDAIVPNCRKECKPPRCECQAKLGFVRAHDGACIPVAECATYRGAYFGGGAVIPPSAPRGGGRTAADNGGGEFGSPPSIAPPSFTGQTPFADQVIATGASPPVVVRPKERQRQLATQSRQSQMNLFADLANSGVTQDLGTAPETSTWATGGHRPPAPAGLSHNRSPSGEQVLVDGADSPEEVTAKCGGRKCPGIEQATKGLNAGPPAGGAKRTKTKSQPYLFAYINPPSSVGNELGAGEDEVDAQLIGHSHEDFEAEGHATQLSIRGVHRDPALIPPLPANLRIFRGRRNPPRWLSGSIRWE